jgi:hypothetical protein
MEYVPVNFCDETILLIEAATVDNTRLRFWECLGVAKTVVVGVTVAVTVFVRMTVAGGVIEGETVGVAVEYALGIVWFWHMFWAMLNSNSDGVDGTVEEVVLKGVEDALGITWFLAMLSSNCKSLINLPCSSNLTLRAATCRAYSLHSSHAGGHCPAVEGISSVLNPI